MLKDGIHPDGLANPSRTSTDQLKHMSTATSLVQKLGEDVLARSSLDGTMAMLINGGKFQDELSRLCTEAGLPLMGSSAKSTGKGTKMIAQDIEAEIIAAVNIIVDYGKRKYSYPRASSTMINFQNLQLLRFGACYDVIQDVLRRFYGVAFPDDPGKTMLFSGHISKPTTNAV